MTFTHRIIDINLVANFCLNGETFHCNYLYFRQSGLFLHSASNNVYAIYEETLVKKYFKSIYKENDNNGVNFK